MSEKVFKYSRGKFKIEPSAIEKAEYSPWGRIFNRIENVCDVIVSLSLKVRFKEISAIEPFFYSLVELFEQLIPLLPEEIENLFNKKINEIKEEIKVWKNQILASGKKIYPENLVEKLQKLKKDLLIIKQLHGLGIPTSKEETEREKLKRVLGLEK